MEKITNFTVKVMQRYLPDALILAIFLTVIVFVLGLSIADKTPIDMANYWGKGFSSLFTFGMQMALVLLTGYALALTPIARRFLNFLTSIPNTPKQALALVAVISFLACYINWGFGFVVGAILAKEMGKKIKGLHFPMVVAAAYGAEIIRGPSSSIPLVVATPGHFLEDQIGIIPVTETLYSGWNITLSIVILIALVLLFISMTPKKENIIEYKADDEDEVEYGYINKTKKEMTFAERLEHSYLVNLLLAAMPIIYLVSHFKDLGFNLNLNMVILIFLALSLVLHRSPAAFLDVIKEGIVSTRGIIIQFPLYAGVAGMMASSGLVTIFADWFITVSNEYTFPFMTFIAAGLVNIFIPSGGGQWAIQGPVMMEAAMALKADIPQTIMAFAWGDAWTNQIQPFWALPLLGVAGLSARDIMGYCLIWLFLSGIIISTMFVGLSFL
ncbi:short-chain fatty acid transporter [Ignatzschineria sp. LJL83]